MRKAYQAMTEEERKAEIIKAAGIDCARMAWEAGYKELWRASRTPTKGIDEVRTTDDDVIAEGDIDYLAEVLGKSWRDLTEDELHDFEAAYRQYRIEVEEVERNTEDGDEAIHNPERVEK